MNDRQLLEFTDVARLSIAVSILNVTIYLEMQA